MCTHAKIRFKEIHFTQLNTVFPLKFNFKKNRISVKTNSIENSISVNLTPLKSVSVTSKSQIRNPIIIIQSSYRPRALFPREKM